MKTHVFRTLRMVLILGLWGLPIAGSASPQTAECPVLESNGWNAWLKDIPGMSTPALHIAGQIVLPSPGYRISIVPGPLDRMNPPSQRFVLVASPPKEMVPQVISTMEVSAQFPGLSSGYNSVFVVCGTQAIAPKLSVEDLR